MTGFQKYLFCLVLFIISLLVMPSFSFSKEKNAQNTKQEALQQQIYNLRQEIERNSTALREEMEELKAQKQEGKEGGMGKITFSGYGETHYNNDSRKQPEMDAHRMVIGVHHTFNEWISSHAEVDFEHAAKDMELEFAYVDFHLSDALGIRAGTLLMPVGYLNEFHEPPLYHSVERPTVQRDIIPTTWNEGGLGIYGGLGDNAWNYRLYLVSTLNAAKFTPSSGIRDGRQEADEALSRDLAVVGRLEYSGLLPGLSVGGSAYSGKANQGNGALGDANVTLLNADGKYQSGPWEFTTLYAQINLSDADKVSAVVGKTIAERMIGGYAEVAYHLLHAYPTEADLTLFGRYEKINTQATVPAGFPSDSAQNRKATVVGLAYRPIPNVAAKVDNGSWSDASGKSWNVFNAGIAYMF